MATTKNGTYYPDNYEEIADIPADMKKMAESIDKQFDGKVDKIEGKELSTNDFTNEDKEKLDGLSNYDDTVIKQDIADIQDKNTSQDELITKLKNNMINLTVEGTNINVQDSSDLPAMVEVSGGVRQETRKGYNLLNVTAKNQVRNGVTMTINDDKSVTFNGTSTAKEGGFSLLLNSTSWNADEFPYNKVLTLSCKGLQKGMELAIAEGNENGVWIRNLLHLLGTEHKISKNISKGENAKFIRVNFTIAKDTVLNNVTVYPMIYEGTEEKIYEAYGESPSSMFSSEVEAVGDNINLFDGQVENGGLDNNTGQLADSGTDRFRTINYIEIGSYNNITLSTSYLEGAGAFGRYYLYDNEYALISNGQITNLDFTIETGNAKYFKFWLLKSRVQNATNIKVEKGKIATSYSPHGQGSVKISKTDSSMNVEIKQENYNLQIQQSMLSGDTFVKENENWFELHNWKKTILTGDEQWTKSSTTEMDRFTLTVNDMTLINSTQKEDIFSNNFKAKLYGNNEIGAIWHNRNIIAINYSAYNTTTIDQFKQFLKDKYNAGNPVYVWYKLATTTKLPCTSEQTQVLEQLYNNETYKFVTNLCTTENLANLKLSYVADTKTYVDNKFKNIEKQLNTIKKGESLYG